MAGNVDEHDALADRPGDREAERGEQDLLAGEAEIPLRTVELAGQRAVERRRDLAEIGRLRCVDGLVVGDTKRAAGKFCNQHGANSSCDVPKMGDLSQKCDTCVNNSNGFRLSIRTAHLRENTLQLCGATYR